MTAMPVPTDTAVRGERPRIVVGIAQHRMAAAVEELLLSEERYDVERLGGRPVDAGVALAVVDTDFLGASTRALAVPSVVLVRSDVDRDALRHRAPAACEWLRTSSTGDELLRSVEHALAAPRPAVPALVAIDAAGPAADAEPSLRAHEQIALLSFGTLSGAAALVALWQAIRL